MIKPENCGMCSHFRNGVLYDYCDLTGEPIDYYEDPCEKGDADDAPDMY